MRHATDRGPRLPVDARSTTRRSTCSTTSASRRSRSRPTSCGTCRSSATSRRVASRSSARPGWPTWRTSRTAVDVVRETGNEQLILLHCVVNYPPPFADLNLRAIETMRQAFGVPVGWSDHTPGSLAPVVATALGAAVVEKHFTTDRERPGTGSPVRPGARRAGVDGARRSATPRRRWGPASSAAPRPRTTCTSPPGGRSSRRGRSRRATSSARTTSRSCDRARASRSRDLDEGRRADGPPAHRAPRAARLGDVLIDAACRADADECRPRRGTRPSGPGPVTRGSGLA